MAVADVLSVHACMGDKAKGLAIDKVHADTANPLSHLAPIIARSFERCQGVRSGAFVQGRSFKGIRRRGSVQGYT
jgi:hypothetical protein